MVRNASQVCSHWLTLESKEKSAQREECLNNDVLHTYNLPTLVRNIWLNATREAYLFQNGVELKVSCVPLEMP